MPPLTIDLSRLEYALNNSEAIEHYLDLHSGTVVAVAPEEPVPGDASKHQVEPERYLWIEPLGMSGHLAMRENFLFDLRDPHAHTALRHALEGRKPLRTFGYELERFPEARQAWLGYQSRRLRELALQWLEDNGLERAGR
jgi:hypothetical protein